jgi:hypothetical protein
MYSWPSNVVVTMLNTILSYGNRATPLNTSNDGYQISSNLHRPLLLLHSDHGKAHQNQLPLLACPDSTTHSRYPHGRSSPWVRKDAGQNSVYLPYRCKLVVADKPQVCVLVHARSGSAQVSHVLCYTGSPNGHHNGGIRC